MAEIWAAAVATVVVGKYSADQQKKSAKKSLNSAAQSAADSLAEQQRQFDITTANQQPFIDAGKAALDRQSQILNGNYTDFYNSPDYLATIEQGQKFMDRSAAARGSLYSSAHTADSQKYGQGLAAQQLNSYWGKLAGQAGQGYNAGNALGQYGQNYANNVGNINQNLAAQRASSYQQVADANSALAGSFGNAVGNVAGYYGNRGVQTQTNPQANYTMNMSNMQGTNWNALGYQTPTYYKG